VFIVCSILAQLIRRSSHGVISDMVHVPDSAWPATACHIIILSRALRLGSRGCRASVLVLSLPATSAR
jgi:hypothetical protein